MIRRGSHDHACHVHSSAYLFTLRIRMITSTIFVYSFKGMKLVFSYNIVGLWRIGQ